MYLSIVIPIFNEEDSIHELVAELEGVIDPLKKYYEIIFVDDGSTDSTLSLLKELAKKDDKIQILSHRRNLGKSHALMHGFHKAKGEYIATLDSDLQDNPTEIPLMLQNLQDKELDLVTGYRQNRQHSGAIKSVSRIANSFILKLFKLKIHDLNCGMKVYKADAAKELKLYGGLHRFIPVMMSELGYTISEHKLTNRSRKFGYSKYKASKVLTDLPDLFTIYFLTKYTARPLHFFGKIGGVLLFIGGAILVYLSILWFMGERIGTRPLLTFGVLLVIAGLQTVFTGLIGDLLVHLHSDKGEKLPIKYETK